MTTAPTYATDWTTQFLRLAADATESQIAWINAQLVKAWNTHPKSYWGVHRKEAALLYVGHLWEMEMATSNTASREPRQGRSRSTIAWSSAQGASRAMAVSGSDGWFMSTSSGQQYLNLRESAPPAYSHTRQ